MLYPAFNPTAVFWAPTVLFNSALAPNAVFWLPVLLSIELNPRAVLLEPFELFNKA